MKKYKKKAVLPAVLSSLLDGTCNPLPLCLLPPPLPLLLPSLPYPFFFSCCNSQLTEDFNFFSLPTWSGDKQLPGNLPDLLHQIGTTEVSSFITRAATNLSASLVSRWLLLDNLTSITWAKVVNLLLCTNPLILFDLKTLPTTTVSSQKKQDPSAHMLLALPNLWTKPEVQKQLEFHQSQRTRGPTPLCPPNGSPSVSCAGEKVCCRRDSQRLP